MNGQNRPLIKPKRRLVGAAEGGGLKVAGRGPTGPHGEGINLGRSWQLIREENENNPASSNADASPPEILSSSY
jgi:hypothetical protein